MIEAFAPNGSNQPFDNAVLPRARGSRHHLLDVGTRQRVVHCSAVHSIAITNQVTRCIPIHYSFNHLLGRPFRCGVLGDVEVQNFPPPVSENDEDEQHLETKRRHIKEIDSHDFISVILKERLPVLGWRVRNAAKNTRDGSLRDDDSEHLQLAMHSWCPPKWICSRHVQNEATYLGSDGRSAATGCLRSRDTGPEPPEALALPPHDSLWLHHIQSGSPPTPDFGQRTPEKTVEGGQFRFGALPLIGHKLKS